MTGTFYYLYCLRDKTQGKIAAKGVDKKRVYAVPYRDIEAIVTEVNKGEFDPKKIKSKLENLQWAEEKVRNHEAVIEEAMQEGPVIPLKFLTLYKSKESLSRTLEKQYQKFRKLLEKLRGKTEWGLKVYVVGKDKLIEQIKKEDEEVIKMKEDLASKPEGVRYFLEKKMHERILEKVDAQLDKCIKDIFEVFISFSTEKPVVNKLLPQGLDDKGGEAVLNVSYLVPEEKIEEFKRTVSRLYDYYFAKGLWLEYTGPWPPHSFVHPVRN